MPVNVIVGGQYGSEGKGKVTAFLAEKHGASIVVRCGGPNSGHTVQIGEKRLVLKHIPAGFHVTDCRLLLASGSYLHLDLFLQEIEALGLDESHVGVSPNAGIIESWHMHQENRLSLQERIASTLSGTGAAVSERVLRSPNFRLAKNEPELRRFLVNVPREVRGADDKGKTVLIEGTQGFGLSLLHSPHFPKTTSRDTTASGFCSEVGVSPRMVTDVTIVFRTYPIRVGGNSGPLRGEISWNVITERSGAPTPVREFTSVTARLRRVAEFDLRIAQMAIQHDLPTITALNHIDYINWDDHGKTNLGGLSLKSRSFIRQLERALGISFDLLGTGPKHKDIIDRAAIGKGLDLAEALG